MKELAKNKKAYFDYEITDKYEAGIVLLGYEVKSIKTNRASMKGSYVTIKRGDKQLPELYLTNTHIPLYERANPNIDYDPDRPRKLLLKKKQIEYLIGKKKEQGLTFVPLKFYIKNNLIKLSFAIGKGKKKHDKREAIKKRDLDRQARSLTKEYIKR